MIDNLPPFEDCKPGFSATEFNVIIAVPPVIEQLKSGLFVPTKTAEADQSASMQGLLVDISPMAGEGVWPKDGPARPMAGDVVWFAKYAGTLVTGDDNREYRVCKDKDVIAVRNRPWVDSDDAPELGAHFFETGRIMDGDKVIREATATMKEAANG